MLPFEQPRAGVQPVQPITPPFSLTTAGARKRPLVPNLAELLEEDEEGSAAPSASEAGRRSDGAALLRSERQSVGSGPIGGTGSGSPPHKYQRKGESALWA